MGGSQGPRNGPDAPQGLPPPPTVRLLPLFLLLTEKLGKELSTPLLMGPYPPLTLHPIPPRPSPHPSPTSDLVRVTHDLPLPIPAAH